METMPASYRLYPLQKDSGALVVLQQLQGTTKLQTKTISNDFIMNLIKYIIYYYNTTH